MFDIKCNYCSNTVTVAEKIPDGWLNSRFREVINGIPSYVPGPTLCPTHVRKTKQMLNAFSKGDVEENKGG